MEDGKPIVSPLVKRVIAVENEQLMIIDDVLYIRKQGAEKFKPITEDKQYAYNVLTWRPLQRIKTDVLQEELLPFLRDIDAAKKNLDITATRAALPKLVMDVLSIPPISKVISDPWRNKPVFRFSALTLNSIPGISQTLESEGRKKVIATTFTGNHASFESYMNNLSWILENIQLDTDLQKLVRIYAEAEFAKTISLEALDTDQMLGPEAYEQSLLRIELMYREKLLNALALIAKSPGSQAARSATLDLYRFELFYIGEYFIARNLAPFPSGEQYIGPGEYFLIGDNRYNSLDCRHWTEFYKANRLVPDDPMSLGFLDNRSPFVAKDEYIKGRQLFTLPF
jgi:signal peptidase I